MRDADNIREVEALGIDMMGFIFWTKSARYVRERPAYLPTQCKRVGVFVNEDTETIRQMAYDYALDFIQLHGSESPDDIRALRADGSFAAVIIKAFNIATADDLSQTTAYEGIADYFLFDTKGKSAGGNGEKFDWSILDNYAGDTPFLLSGGIGPDDADRVSAFRHPQCVGIDLNSRFETAPGLKDVTALRQFLLRLNGKL